MNRRKELCRNFQRGSCQYGDRCRFLHVSQQQSKPNSFGFGTQSTPQFLQTSQQQKPNPFGFGVQNDSQLKGTTNFGARYQSPTKPFENKWTRSSSTATENSTPSRQADTQPQAATHKCTDPESCKRQIVEDFKNEAPLWKLTCYGHWKYRPCDIVGDISYEELRTAAYEDARRGLPLQSIVERERNLLNSKLIEFDNLLRNPYVIPNSSSAGTLFPGANNGTSSMSAQSNAPPLFSSFSQLGQSTYIGSNGRPPTPGTPPSTFFHQPSLSQNNSQSSSGMEMKFGASGAFGSQLRTQPSGISPGPNTSNLQNGVMATGSGRFSPPGVLPQFPSSTNNQLPSFLDGPRVGSDTLHQASVVDKQEVSPDDSIWLKKEWDIGEIPEVAPPEGLC